MTRIFVQRSSAGSSSSNTNRPSVPGSSSPSSQPQAPCPLLVLVANDEESNGEGSKQVTEVGRVDFCCGGDPRTTEYDDTLPDIRLVDKTGCVCDEIVDIEKICIDDSATPGGFVKGLDERITPDRSTVENETSSYSIQMVPEGPFLPPPPPPIPPPKPSLLISTTSRFSPGSSNTMRNKSPRITKAWPVVSTRTMPSDSRPSSPGSHGDSEGYNSADEQNPCFGSSYNDAEKERQFEIDIRRAKGLEVKRMLEDGNCLFRAIADQVYGDSEAYDLTRHLCMDYMEKERDHFSQFVTEGFKSYCIRKRRDKVYGNNVEIQALSEMFNRPIHIYSYSTEPINIFHRSYNTDMPPIRLSYHHGNHYNSLVDPRRLTVGAGLGFSSLQGHRDINKDEVKAAIKAQQDQQIDNALLAEGRFYSDMELTEKEIELMVMEASRAEYLGGYNNQQPHPIEIGSSTSGAAEPSSSGASGGGERDEGYGEGGMGVLMSMGFSYVQAKEAFSIFGDDVDSMLCYILETDANTSTKRKGKEATTK